MFAHLYVDVYMCVCVCVCVCACVCVCDVSVAPCALGQVLEVIREIR